MSKNVFRVVVSVIAVVCVGVISFQNRQEDTKLSDLAMANIEALAAGEIPNGCKSGELVGYFMSEYTRHRQQSGKRCGLFGYHCPCGCSGWEYDPDCYCPDVHTVWESGQECVPNTNDNSCCNKNEEEVYFDYE